MDRTSEWQALGADDPSGRRDEPWRYCWEGEGIASGMRAGKAGTAHGKDSAFTVGERRSQHRVSDSMAT